MTQHVLPQDEQADVTTFKHLAAFIGGFAVFAVILAIGVAIFAP